MIEWHLNGTRGNTWGIDYGFSACQVLCRQLESFHPLTMVVATIIE